MDRTFTINGKEYEGAKYDYNTSCLFEEMGIQVSEIGKKPQSVLRAYLAISSGMDVEEAGKEIEAHIVSGNSLTEMSNVFAKELSESGFFQSLIAKSEETAEKKTKK